MMILIRTLLCFSFPLLAPLPLGAQGVAEFQKHLEPTNAPPAAVPPAPGQRQPPQAPPPTQGFDVPKPTIVTQPNFKPASSYGITTESDGTPFTDHKTYSIDTAFFIKKLKDGIARKGSDPALDALLNELEEASFAYDQAEGTIHFEEQTTMGKPVRLDENPGPKGLELREQMKTAITRMAELRAKISSQHGAVLSAGRLAEEK